MQHHDEPRRLSARLFGPLAIENGSNGTLGPRDLGGARPKQVLELLLAARGHRVPTDRLFDQLWGDERPQNAAGSLQTFVSVLRSHLTADRRRARELVVTEPEAYRVPAELVELDLDRFDELVERASREPTRAARRSLEQALALVRGDVLEDEPYAAWAQDLRSTYQGRVLGARLDLAEAALAERDFGEALAQADAAVTLDRFGERAYRLRMLALYALGRQHEALDAFRRFRALLDDELGLEPTAATRGLEAAILRQDDLATLLPRPVAGGSGGEPDGSIRLLGRAAELGSLERAVRQALGGSLALVVVDGETGIGKTRLLDELADGLAGARVGRATCSPLERHLPYVPLAAALRGAVGVDGLRERRGSPLGRILPELGVRDAGGGEAAELAALEALVEVLAEQAPVVLVLDDLHAADDATVAALSYLQRRGAEIGGAVVAAIAGERADADHPARRLRPDVLVRLAPLSAGDLAPLGVPGLHEVTGGNPRFVNELVTAGAEALTTALAETLLAECRAEGPRAYRILSAASVLEPPFDPEPLADVLDLDATELVEELDRLCERRILRVDGPSFRFRYALVRDVLQGSLSPARVRLLRRRLKDAPEPAGRPAAVPLRGARR